MVHQVLAVGMRTGSILNGRLAWCAGLLEGQADDGCGCPCHCKPRTVSSMPALLSVKMNDSYGQGGPHSHFTSLSPAGQGRASAVGRVALLQRQQQPNSSRGMHAQVLQTHARHRDISVMASCSCAVSADCNPGTRQGLVHSAALLPIMTTV